MRKMLDDKFPSNFAINLESLSNFFEKMLEIKVLDFKYVLPKLA